MACNDKIIVKKGGCFPTTPQILLLKAALFEPNEAIQYWHQWVLANNYTEIDYNSPDFLPNFFDPLDVGSMNIMSLVYKNLANSNETVIQRLKGHYRKNWFDNTRLQNHTKQFIEILNDNNIEYILIGALPIALNFYADISTRTMPNVSVLIQPQHKKNVIEIFTNLPFSYKISPLEQATFDYLNAVHLYAPSGLCVHLHWNIFQECANMNEIDTVFWQKKQAFLLLDTSSKMLSITHQFFLSLVAGRSYEAIPPFIWVADCYQIFHSKQNEIDWDELISLAIRYKFVLFTREALLLLKNEFKISIPNNCLNKFYSIEISKLEKKYYQSISKGVERNDSLYISKKIRNHARKKYYMFQVYRRNIENRPFLIWYFMLTFKSLWSRLKN